MTKPSKPPGCRSRRCRRRTSLPAERQGVGWALAGRPGLAEPGGVSSEGGLMSSPQDPGHRARRRQLGRGGGEPGRPKRLRHECLRRQCPPVRRRRGRGALPEDSSTVVAGDFPSGVAGEARRPERLRRQQWRQRLPSTTSPRAVRSRPRARPTVATSSGPGGVAVSPAPRVPTTLNQCRRRRLAAVRLQEPGPLRGLRHP